MTKTSPIPPTSTYRFDEVDKAALRELTARLKMRNNTETLLTLIHGALDILKERDLKPAAVATLKTRNVKLASMDEATKISPALRRRIEREVRAAKSGDLLARIWIQKNAQWVTAYALRDQKRK